MKRRNKDVWVERDETGRIIRLFHSTKCDDFYRANLAGRASTCPIFDAKHEIWNTLFERSGGHCEYCGKTITKNSDWTKGEMHEEVPRGRGGDISLENSKMICRKCHRDDSRGHANRKLQWSGGETIERNS